MRKLIYPIILASNIFTSNTYSADILKGDSIKETRKIVDIPSIICEKNATPIDKNNIPDNIFVDNSGSNPIIKIRDNNITDITNLEAVIIDRDNNNIGKQYCNLKLKEPISNLDTKALDNSYDVLLLKKISNTYIIIGRNIVIPSGATMPLLETVLETELETEETIKKFNNPNTDSLFPPPLRKPIAELYLLPRSKLEKSKYTLSLLTALSFNDDLTYNPNGINFSINPKFNSRFQISAARSINNGFRIGLLGGLKLISDYESKMNKENLSINTNDGLYDFNIGGGAIFNINHANRLEINSRLLLAYIQDSSKKDFSNIIISNKKDGLLLEARLEFPNLIISENFSLGLGVNNHSDIYTKLIQNDLDLNNSINNTFDGGIMLRAGPDIFRLFTGYQNDSTYLPMFDPLLNPTTNQIYGNGIKADIIFRFTRNMPLYLIGGTEFTRGDFKRTDFNFGLSWYNKVVELIYKLSNIKTPDIASAKDNSIILQLTYPPAYADAKPKNGSDSQNLLPTNRNYSK